MKPITLTYDKERDLKLDLYMPENEKPKLFIYMHGGGLTSGSRDAGIRFDTLVSDGIAAASLDYRMYPDAKFPDFIEDCARAVAFLKTELDGKISGIYVGGSSAGAYLSMMLLFDKHYLGAYGIDPFDINGWVLDAGQPTVHFNVLAERGLDPRLVRIDEAAPLWFVDEKLVPENRKVPDVLIISSEHDMECRLEQLRLLEATMKHFGWQEDRLRFRYMEGYSHCSYIGEPVFAELIESIVK